MHHASDYEEAVNFASGGLLVGHVAYPGYPIQCFERDGFSFLVEGQVYNRDLESLREELVALASIVFRDPDGADNVRRWIQSADGDFVIVVAEPRGEEFFAFSDALGRLPIYVFEDGQRLLLARECKFVAGARGAFEFDRLGCAQSLWVGYPMGKRTLLKGVERGGCGLFVRAAIRNSRLRVVRQELVSWNFGSYLSNTPPIRTLAGELVDLFGLAIRQRGDRVQGGPQVISLSGGHDSRSVAAGLRRFDGDFTAVSREDVGRPGRDWRLAQIIAQELGVPWELMRVSQPSPETEARLAWLKDGLNSVGTAFMIEYLTKIATTYGRRTVYITGDGGDKVFPDLRPLRPLATLNALVRELVEKHALGDHTVIEELMGLEDGTLERDLRSHVIGYPEERWSEKAVHFSLCERGRKWLFEGEDRNRFFMWQSSPCYALPLFRHAMAVRGDLKRHLRLYREFQAQLWPTLTRIDHANVGFPIASIRFRLKVRAHSRYLALPKAARDAIRHSLQRLSRQEAPASVSATERVMNQWRRSSRLRSLMEESGLRRYLRMARQRGFKNVWTLVAFGAQCEERLSGTAGENS